MKLKHTRRGYKVTAKRTDKLAGKACEIRLKYANTNISIGDLAREYSVDESSIKSCVHGWTYKYEPGPVFEELPIRKHMTIQSEKIAS